MRHRLLIRDHSPRRCSASERLPETLFTAGGADLLLAGPVPAEITESQWILDNAGAQTFSFANPSGSFDLQVQGESALTTGDIGDSIAAIGHGHYGASWSGTGASWGLSVTRNDPGVAIQGSSLGPNGAGVVGVGSAGGQGVLGSSDTAAAVFGSSVQSHAFEGLTNSATASVASLLSAGGGPLIEGYDSSVFGALPVFEVDGAGNVVAASFTGDGSGLTGLPVGSGGTEPTSLFGSFGGTGVGDRTISGTENLGTRIESYHDLIVPAGSTLVINRGIGWISASGTCQIDGTITAEALGIGGAPAMTASTTAPGTPGGRANALGLGFGMVGSSIRLPVDFAVSGGGGGGGGAGSLFAARGGHGGGALDRGGYGGCSGAGCPEIDGGTAWNFGQKRDMIVGPGARSDFFSLYLHYRGGGGGNGAVGSSGGTGGAGGRGGGIIYLECANLVFTGTLDVRGADGGDATGSGGGGGGGGGGVALVRTTNVISNTGQILVDPGVGGSGTGGNGDGGTGQAGYGAIVEF